MEGFASPQILTFSFQEKALFFSTVRQKTAEIIYYFYLFIIYYYHHYHSCSYVIVF